MNHNISNALMGLVSLSLISGCASVSPRKAVGQVESRVQERTGREVHWAQEKFESQAAEESIQKLLAQPLTADGAAQIALLKNAGFQARLQGLGLAQADLVRAGLLENPIFFAGVRFPAGGGQTNTEFSITQNFLSVLTLLLEKRVAKGRLEQAQFDVSEAVLDLAAEVKEATYALQSAEEMLEYLRTVTKAQEAAASLAERQLEAGTINALDLSRQQAAYHDAQVTLIREESEVAQARERLGLLMGLPTQEKWEVAHRLPDLPSSDPSPGGLEELALSQRWDLMAARKEPEILAREQIINRLSLFPTLRLGLDTDQESPEGTRLTGPALEISLPVFDQRRASGARITAQRRQSEYLVAALEREIRSEVRMAQTQLVAARRAADEYRSRLLPLRQQIVGESLKRYNYMLLGVFQLLQTKQDEIETHSRYTGALKDYWIAHARLERAVGGHLPKPAESSTAPAAAPEPAKTMPTPTPPSHEPHHHGGQ